jgi:hypothetical protein
MSGTQRRHCQFCKVTVRHQAEGVMRAAKFFITATIFSSIFISIVLMSAVVTDAVHSHIAAHVPIAVN